MLRRHICELSGMGVKARVYSDAKLHDADMSRQTSAGVRSLFSRHRYDTAGEARSVPRRQEVGPAARCERALFSPAICKKSDSPLVIRALHLAEALAYPCAAPKDGEISVGQRLVDVIQGVNRTERSKAGAVRSRHREVEPAESEPHAGTARAESVRQRQTRLDTLRIETSLPLRDIAVYANEKVHRSIIAACSR